MRNRILIIFFLFVSCTDSLNLEPLQSLPVEKTLSRPEHVEALVYSAYSATASSSAFGGYLFLVSELLANEGDLRWQGTFANFEEFDNKKIDVENSIVSSIWMNAYNVINICNQILDNASIIENRERENWVRGHALFLRALMHFELTKLFSKPYSKTVGTSDQLAVPLMLKPHYKAEDAKNEARNSVLEVYQQIVADLRGAYQLLPEAEDQLADRYAANALLARIFLTLEEYELATSMATDVIDNSGHTLVAKFSNVFNNTEASSEDILAFVSTAQDPSGYMHTHFADRDHGGRGDLSVEKKHFEIYDPRDPRSHFFYVSGNFPDYSYWTNKWIKADNEGETVFLRLAEMYLIRAESNIRLNKEVGASPFEDINQLRTRAGLLTLSSADLTDVLLERRFEFAFEGHALHEAKRLKRNIGALPFTDASLVLPIPQRELEANELLNTQQNEGY